MDNLIFYVVSVFRLFFSFLFYIEKIHRLHWDNSNKMVLSFMSRSVFHLQLQSFVKFNLLYAKLLELQRQLYSHTTTYINLIAKSQKNREKRRICKPTSLIERVKILSEMCCLNTWHSPKPPRKRKPQLKSCLDEMFLCPCLWEIILTVNYCKMLKPKFKTNWIY